MCRGSLCSGQATTAHDQLGLFEYCNRLCNCCATLCTAAGFVDTSPGAWTEDYLLQQLDARMPQNMQLDGWVEEVEEEEDLTPKYVNGKRVLVNSEIE